MTAALGADPSSAIPARSLPVGPAGIQGRRPQHLSRSLRHHQHQDTPSAPSAHIKPVADGGEWFWINNGLLLRSDVHTLYDGGYLAVDTSHRLQVSPRLHDDFGNGQQYYAKGGQLIELPERRLDRPHRDFLEWHLDTVFKAS